MSVPKKKLSKRRTRARRSHHRVAVPTVMMCEKENCNVPVQPHHACQKCGEYNGRDVMQKQAKTEAAVKKVTAKAAPKKEDAADKKEKQDAK